MKFYLFRGKNTDKHIGDDSETRNEIRERRNDIRNATVEFNRSFGGESFVYIDCCDVEVSGGLIMRNDGDAGCIVDSFLAGLGLNVEKTDVEEATFSDLSESLSQASREYIRSSDRVLESFGIDELDNRRRWGRSEFGENLIKDTEKDYVYGKLTHLPSADSIKAELDRIYSGKAPAKKHGHPVHYLIETDDKDTRREIHIMLLEALYANGRISNRRYSFTDIEYGERVNTDMLRILYNASAGGTVIVRFGGFGAADEGRYADPGRQMIEAVCGIMKEHCNDVLTVLCLPRECTPQKNLINSVLGYTSIVELCEDLADRENSEKFLRMLAKNYGIRPDRELFSLLDDDSYLAPQLRSIFDRWYNGKLKNKIFPQYSCIESPDKKVLEEEKGSAYDDLMKMIGLENAKRVIDEAIAYNRAQKLFADRGMKCERTSMHMVFTGNPGTAKTTVARLFARIMKENGILSGGHLVEVGRGDLVGKYVGWTAPTVKNRFAEAKGGVLFIDEAYSLVDDRRGSFGDEAINTIVQEMENHRDDLIVIFAGYPDEMLGFLDKNPGLRSRIAYHVPFDDYSTSELLKIAELTAEKKGITLTDGALNKLGRIFDRAVTESDFGNGRFVRNVIEKAKMAQSSRIVKMDPATVSDRDIVTITEDDIEMPFRLKTTEKRKLGFCG